jgi:hypothetical protein
VRTACLSEYNSTCSEPGPGMLIVVIVDSYNYIGSVQSCVSE